MELINTGNDLFDPISELFFLDHPGFYPAATPAYGGVTANPKSFAVSGNVRSQHRFTRYMATLRASFSRPRLPPKIASRVTRYCRTTSLTTRSRLYCSPSPPSKRARSNRSKSLP